MRSFFSLFSRNWWLKLLALALALAVFYGVRGSMQGSGHRYVPNNPIQLPIQPTVQVPLPVQPQRANPVPEPIAPPPPKPQTEHQPEAEQAPARANTPETATPPSQPPMRYYFPWAIPETIHI